MTPSSSPSIKNRPNICCKWFQVTDHKANHNSQVKLLKARLPGPTPAGESFRFFWFQPLEIMKFSFSIHGIVSPLLSLSDEFRFRGYLASLFSESTAR